MSNLTNPLLLANEPRPVVAIRFLDARIASQPPDYATPGAAGLDLRAAISSPLTLAAGAVELVPTGIAIHLANPGLAAMVLPRSGLGHKQGLVLGNLVGLIDSDYQGEIFVSLWNRGQEPVVIEPLMRIAQLVVVPVIQVAFQPVVEFAPSQRGTSGFGSTGSH
jgi:dUTP pyrophosphatase